MYHFEYAGTLKGADTSPVEGIKLASVEDPISILLYPGRWFPMTGPLYQPIYRRDAHPGSRDERVVGSGSGVAASKSLPGNRTEYTFKWARPGFPGTIIAGKFLEPITRRATCPRLRDGNTQRPGRTTSPGWASAVSCSCRHFRPA